MHVFSQYVWELVSSIENFKFDLELDSFFFITKLKTIQ